MIYRRAIARAICSALLALAASSAHARQAVAPDGTDSSAGTRQNLFDRQYIGYYPQSASYKDASAYFAGRGRTFTMAFSRSF